MDRISTTKCAIVDRFVEQYYSRVYLFAAKLTNAHSAEDVAQEVFTRLASIPDLEERDLSISYLLKIAHNLIRQEYRQHARFRRVQQCFDGCDASRAGGPAPEATRELVTRAWSNGSASLTPNEQDTLRLTVLNELSLKDASEAMGVRVTTLTNWKYRGLRKLAAVADSAA